MKIVWRIIAILVGALFVFAGVTKIIEIQSGFRPLDPMEFARGIDNYKSCRGPSVWGFALYLPWLEILCGLGLIFRRFYSGAFAIVLGFMIVFIMASIAAKARGIDITCGCFGHVSDQLSFVWHMVLDFAILGAVVALCFAASFPAAGHGNRGIDGDSPRMDSVSVERLPSDNRETEGKSVISREGYDPALELIAALNPHPTLSLEKGEASLLRCGLDVTRDS